MQRIGIKKLQGNKMCLLCGFSSKDNFNEFWKKMRLLTESVFLCTEKEPQKGKMKNPKVQKSKRCENVKSKKRIIQKMRKCNIRK